MRANWKDNPHWVLRFTPNGEWELTGPDDKVKSQDGIGERCLSVDLEMENVPQFNISGILV